MREEERSVISPSILHKVWQNEEMLAWHSLNTPRHYLWRSHDTQIGQESALDETQPSSCCCGPVPVCISVSSSGWLSKDICPLSWSTSSTAFLNSHALLHIGHRCSLLLASHFWMHWIWKAWSHAPQTTGLSSPGYLQSGGHPSYCVWQMPHMSLSPDVQDHAATACHLLMRTLKPELLIPRRTTGWFVNTSWRARARRRRLVVRCYLLCS